MGTTLTGKRIKDTYDGLLKTTDNQPLDSSTVKRLNDGLGNPCPIYLSQTSVEVDNGSFKVGGSLLDGSGGAGSSGQLLSSTGTGVSWVDGGGLTVIEDVTHHNFATGAVGDYFLPINSTTPATSSADLTSYIIPIYNGDIARIIMMTSVSTTGNSIILYNGTTAIGSTASKFSTTANTATVVTLNTVTFSLGDRLNLKLQTQTATFDAQFSILWHYTRPV